jgi:hypothetical protein
MNLNTCWLTFYGDAKPCEPISRAKRSSSEPTARTSSRASSRMGGGEGREDRGGEADGGGESTGARHPARRAGRRTTRGQTTCSCSSRRTARARSGPARMHSTGGSAASAQTPACRWWCRTRCGACTRHRGRARRDREAGRGGHRAHVVRTDHGAALPRAGHRRARSSAACLQSTSSNTKRGSAPKIHFPAPKPGRNPRTATR